MDKHLRITLKFFNSAYFLTVSALPSGGVKEYSNGKQLPVCQLHKSYWGRVLHDFHQCSHKFVEGYVTHTKKNIYILEKLQDSAFFQRT